MKQNSVSIILPVHNRSKLALSAMSSALEQQGVDAEIIIIDDGSEEPFSFAQESKSTVFLIRQPNQGPAAARNVGIQRARNEFIAFLDSDDLFYPSKLRDQIAGMARIAADWSCGSYEYWDDVDLVLRTMRIDSFPLGFWRHLCPVGCSSIVARRSLLLSVDGFDESFYCGEDWDLLIRLGEKAAPFLCSKPLYFYRTHGESMSRKHPEKWRSSWKMIEKKHGLTLERPRMYTNCPTVFEKHTSYTEHASAADSIQPSAVSLA